jgi:hypothetical protein
VERESHRLARTKATMSILGDHCPASKIPSTLVRPLIRTFRWSKRRTRNTGLDAPATYMAQTCVPQPIKELAPDSVRGKVRCVRFDEITPRFCRTVLIESSFTTLYDGVRALGLCRILT